MKKFRQLIYLSLPLLIGVSMPRCESDGPSSWFKHIDKDFNGELSLNEWMHIYGTPHTYEIHKYKWQVCRGNHFELADCDRNNSLTWHEYYEFKFNGQQSCTNKSRKDVTRPVLNKETGDWFFPD